MSKKSLLSEAELEAYKENLIVSLVNELFIILEEEEQLHGPKFRTQCEYSILASLTSSFVYGSLIKETDQQAAIESYLETKQDIQDTIAAAFSSAFARFNPETDPEYICEITCLDDGNLNNRGTTH